MKTFQQLKLALKTPSNTAELEALYAENGLCYYTPLEELLNIITHFAGVIISLIAFGFMLAHSSTPQSYVVSVLSTIGFLILYLNSTFYHASRNLKNKRLLRHIDHASINIIIVACGTGVCLLHGSPIGYAVFGVSVAIAITMAVMCITNFEKFKPVTYVFDFINGGLMTAMYFVFHASIPSVAIYLCIAGIISVLLGAALFGVRKRYVHTIFHIFVLVGPVCFYFASFVQLT